MNGLDGIVSGKGDVHPAPPLIEDSAFRAAARGDRVDDLHRELVEDRNDIASRAGGETQQGLQLPSRLRQREERLESEAAAEHLPRGQGQKQGTGPSADDRELLLDEQGLFWNEKSGRALLAAQGGRAYLYRYTLVQARR